MKLFLKLAAAALIANATWRLGTEYTTHYRFSDALHQAAMKRDVTESELRRNVLALAAEYDVPLADEAVAIRLQEHHTLIDGSYVKPILLLPGYRQPWKFSFAVDGYLIAPPKLHS